MQRTGGCACGTVRYQVTGEPLRIAVCHCRDCQRRTGSAFGIGCVFPKDAVTLTQGATKTFERISNAGNWVRIHFCPECGSSVTWDFEALPQARGIAGGSFDDTSWIDPKLHVWTKTAHEWITFPDDADVLLESNFGQVAAS